MQGAGCLEVGHGLHFGEGGAEGRLGEAGTVARRAYAPQARACGKAGEQPDEVGLERLQGVAVVAAVGACQHSGVAVDEHALHRGGAEVDAEEEVALGLGQIPLRHGVGLVSGPEGGVVCLVLEKAGQGLPGGGAACVLLQPHEQGRDRDGFRIVPGCQAGAEGHHVLAVREGQGLLRRKPQRQGEALHELGQEVQGPAQKGDVALDGLSAGKAADGLLHHGLQDGNGQILPRHALVQERDQIRLGEDPAARGYGMNGFGVRGEGVEAKAVRVQEGGHLVDEGARAAGAGLVHAQIDAAPEVEYLGVLAAKLDGDVRLRRGLGYALGGGDDFLHEGKAQGLRQVERRGAGDGAVNQGAGMLRLAVLQNGGERLPACRAVALVALKENAACFVCEHRLDGDGPEIDAQIERICHCCSHMLRPGACAGLACPGAARRADTLARRPIPCWAGAKLWA